MYFNVNFWLLTQRQKARSVNKLKNSLENALLRSDSPSTQSAGAVMCRGERGHECGLPCILGWPHRAHTVGTEERFAQGMEIKE